MLRSLRLPVVAALLDVAFRLARPVGPHALRVLARRLDPRRLVTSRRLVLDVTIRLDVTVATVVLSGGGADIGAPRPLFPAASLADAGGRMRVLRSLAVL
jgi:hypothetical protein